MVVINIKIRFWLGVQNYGFILYTYKRQGDMSDKVAKCAAKLVQYVKNATFAHHFSPTLT